MSTIWDSKFANSATSTTDSVRFFTSGSLTTTAKRGLRSYILKLEVCLKPRHQIFIHGDFALKNWQLTIQQWIWSFK